MDLRPLLVDTNVIIECYRTGSWRALSQRYSVETVEECVAETHTGYQNRRPEQCIDQAELCRSLRAVYPVTQQELATAVSRDPTIGGLDAGEKHLWAHALSRGDVWILCGPDASSLRVGVNLGFGDRLVALEKLLDDIGHRPHVSLSRQYRKTWLEEKLVQFKLSRPGGLR